MEFKADKSKVLVVDDIELNVELLVDILTVEDYHVETANNGKMALEKVEENPPDLILLDIMMPGIDGYDVCRKIKSDPITKLIPIVMITALMDMEDKIKSIEAGADDFISKPFNKYEVLARCKSLLKMKHFTDELEHAETVIGSLALGVEAKDPYTEGHCSRLSMFSVNLGKKIGLSDNHLKALEWGGILHDLGKIGIPESILLKQGKLTVKEFAVMKDHPVIGDRICKPLKSLKLVLPIIRNHHERCDGSGYPDGLMGEDIPITARILTIADIWDALRTERPYKPAFSIKKSTKIITDEAKKGWWDSHLVDTFIDMMRTEKEFVLRSQALKVHE